jgi:hypothetical protein
MNLQQSKEEGKEKCGTERNDLSLTNALHNKNHFDKESKERPARANYRGILLSLGE